MEFPKDKDGLLELKLRLQVEIDSTRKQVREAKRRHASGRMEVDDSEWLRRAETALEEKGRQVQRIQLALSRLKKERSESIDAAFREAAREILEQRLFESIMSAAHRRLGSTWNVATEGSAP